MRKPMTEEQLAREIRRAKRFNDTAFILTILFAAFIVIGLLHWNDQYKFSSKRWKAEPEQRGNMIFSLLTEQKLYGMPRSEVTELLGYDQNNVSMDDPEHLTYYLGSVTDPVGERWLILELNHDTVESFYIQTE